MKNKIVYLLMAVSFTSQARNFTKVYAAGLTYNKHIHASSEHPDKNHPIIFVKEQRSLVQSESTHYVSVPNDNEIYAALEGIKKGSSPAVKAKFKDFPKMFDYEAEIGVLFTRDITAEDLAQENLK